MLNFSTQKEHWRQEAYSRYHPCLLPDTSPTQSWPTWMGFCQNLDCFSPLPQINFKVLPWRARSCQYYWQWVLELFFDAFHVTCDVRVVGQGWLHEGVSCGHAWCLWPCRVWEAPCSLAFCQLQCILPAVSSAVTITSHGLCLIHSCCEENLSWLSLDTHFPLNGVRNTDEECPWHHIVVGVALCWPRLSFHNGTSRRYFIPRKGLSWMWT
jgi:hypothetical protein